MSLKFFQIPARGCELSEADLNGFLQTRRILTVDRRWVDMGENSFWAICVDYLDASNRKSADTSAAGGRNRVDYRQVLPPDQFEKFAALRDLRKELAKQDGVPVYAIMTNEQLAQAVQREIRDKADLQAIPGLGEAKVEKYGQRIVDFLNRSGDDDDATDRKSV